MTLLALRAAVARRVTFGHLRTRLSVLYATLFAVALLIVAAVAQIMIVSHARSSVRAELTSSGTVFDRIWSLRSQSLIASTDVLARDFGFRAAVASGDRATIESALLNLKERVGMGSPFIVTLDGTVVGDGTNTIRSTVGKLPFRLAVGRRDAVVASGTGLYRMVASPIMAPTEIGWIIFAVRLDGAEMRALEQLSAIPLTATILGRDMRGRWTPATESSVAVSEALDELVEQAQTRKGRAPETIDLQSGQAFVLAKPLAAADGEPEAVLLFSYPVANALAPYRALQLGILLTGLIGLILVIWGSRRLATGISRPIIALDKAARSLEQGERTEVPVEGADELGRLAESFNKMSAGIVEREHRIAHLAFHDALTGLPNRVFFREQLDGALGRAVKRQGAVAVLCLDLDGFKGVNDTLGHPVGDALLNIIGAQLGELAIDGMVSRLGGDEFAIILADDAVPGRPRLLAQEIIDRMRQPMQAAGHQIATGVSIGIAIGPDDGADVDTLLKNADLALYRAKQDGRGVYRYFEPALDAAARKRRQMELDLRDALRFGQLRLEYQPIVYVQGDRVGCFEALLRWEHPERGAISPLDFIPVAEETGLIVSIGEWVLNEATRQAKQWPDHVRVAVNVSPLQFRNTGFLSLVFRALAQSGLAPDRLEIEITESVFLDSTEPTVALLHRIRELGVRIALDDFGTGYSSLSYLRSFPFDKIKIDRSFITNFAENDSAIAIVRAIIDLANALNMETTAEGVEDEEQLEQLKLQGCTSVQGFLFSRSIPSSEVLAMTDIEHLRAAA